MILANIPNMDLMIFFGGGLLSKTDRFPETKGLTPLKGLGLS